MTENAIGPQIFGWIVLCAFTYAIVCVLSMLTQFTRRTINRLKKG